MLRSDRPRGKFVVVVGPDGSGKSTVVNGLSAAMEATTLYWRPGFLPMAGSLLRNEAPTGINSDPHARTADGTVKATLRSLYYSIDYVVGSRVVVRRAVRSGRSVIADRWIQDMIVDPRRYGLKATRVLRLAAKLSFPVDTLVILHVEPAVITSRKDELPEAEILRQYEAWTTIRSGVREVAWVENGGGAGAAIESVLRLTGTNPESEETP